MSEEPSQTRTRLKLRSCLKITPPITPDLSAAPSPCDSGRTSPALMSDSGSSVGCSCRKTVSFCSDTELEEIHWADEWDRTPAAVTPKLSYQDILELKQLRVTIPYNSPPPPPRQPFTTSAPSTSKPQFPVSRFASTASHTPSRWKNRSEPHRADIDPEILPYLEAVPIRLLPLLPQSPTELVPAAEACLEPHPQTPTPTASPVTRPSTQHHSDPPELRIEPIVSLIPRQTPPHHLNIAFTPLLPVQEPPPIAPAPVAAPTVPVPPRRKINMTFLPVNSAPEPECSPVVSVNSPAAFQGGVGISASAPLPSTSSVAGTDHSADADHTISPKSEAEMTHLTPTTCSSDTSSPMSPPPPFSLSLPTMLSTHPHPSSVESDTETDTDIYTDTDGESDAPSTSTVGSSLPSSPPCEYDDDDSHLEDMKLQADFLPSGYYPRIHEESDPGSYFPPVLPLPLAASATIPVAIPASSLMANALPVTTSKPGQTPPLSVLYPSPQSKVLPLPALDVPSVAQPGPPSEESQTPVILSVDSAAAPPPVLSMPLPLLLNNAVDGDTSLPLTPLSMSNMLRRKLILEALPSPALVPPSPFELEPTSLGSGPTMLPAEEVNVAEALMSADKLSGLRIVDASRLDATPVVSAASSLTDDSPMLTLESMRESWDAQGRAKIERAQSGGAHPVPIAPSLSRRRSS